MKIGIPRESLTGEKRVAATPVTVGQLIDLGFEVLVEKKAGIEAGFSDTAYKEVGAKVSVNRTVWHSDIIYKVNAPTESEISNMKEGAILVSFIEPAQNSDLIQLLNSKKITVLAMDMTPRISRAQPMDALSSFANISGYRAVIEAANAFDRLFSGQITAAGKISPAKVLVVGAGVAGLASIATAGSLGAIVRAFDTRLEVAEQIESMGAEFLKLDFPQEEGGGTDGYAKVMSDEFIAAEMKLFKEQARDVDIIITTAAIPGRPSPKLITKEMVDSMKPGSVIVDLAAKGGGNCEYTVPGGKIITRNGVTVVGYTDMVNRLAGQSSQLYATNLVNLVKLACPEKNGVFNLDFDDVIIRHMTICDQGEVMYPPPPIQVSVAPKTEPTYVKVETDKQQAKVSVTRKLISLVGVFGAILWVGAYAPVEFLNHFMVFILACVVGYYVVWNVTYSLHTPLMSETNAISGIIIIGALVQIVNDSFWLNLLAFIGILLVSINIFGGFSVTNRMLNMFRKG
ncbi:MAG: Re/Si-specific NAD(P)(+) transhydrogenase subunit alpha [Neisseriaceae bacterium]|nr:MAG: Re/Si-specific NAD(P)(+) transhydrogenase subunit alpha [Neisseriaceae bacterium]